MTVRFRIPTPLRSVTGGLSEVEVAGDTLAGSLGNLEARYPGMKERLVDESGEIRRFVNLFVNGEDVRFLSGLATPLKPGDEVSIVPAVAGG